MARHASQGDARLEQAMAEKLRSVTRHLHQSVEDSLDLLATDLTSTRLRQVVARLSTFWYAAEAGVDAWAAASEEQARQIDWARRRRAHLFARQALALGASVGELGWDESGPSLAAPVSTGGVLGRLYVLEGSTLGGQIIVRHLASVAGGRDHDWRCFTPYGDATGPMWIGLRRFTSQWVSDGGDLQAVVEEATATFGSLAAWCMPLRRG